MPPLVPIECHRAPLSAIDCHRATLTFCPTPAPSRTQAAPVWERLRAKRRRARQAETKRAASVGAPPPQRPPWSDAVSKPPALSKGGLKMAKDKEMAPRPKALGLWPLNELL